MSSFTFKFATTQTNITPAFNIMNNEISQGFNSLYPSFGSSLRRAIVDKLFITPFSVELDVGDFNRQRPDDIGKIHFTYVWASFAAPNTPGYWIDLICDLDGTTVDPDWFEATLAQRWDRRNKTTRATTTAQRAVNGGITSIDLIDTGNNNVWLNEPEFPEHKFA